MKLFLAVAAGGAIGATARYAAVLIWPETFGRFPWTTFAINVIGSFALGIIIAMVGHSVMARTFLGVGVLGGFTTFSTFAWQGEQLLSEERPGIAIGYLAGSVVCGLFAAWLGLRTGGWLRD
ncbi:fluoride efflux transporter FluC [Catelliglobosispora koreensis]|uniref:fluoride efflux transporter FluC n=1 Tax=Catelliglobosispora koreensis TaxID=129052 RepID=UPI0012FC4F29|nr:CrcB family protein [Catelliglobosispora koreensis]